MLRIMFSKINYVYIKFGNCTKYLCPAYKIFSVCGTDIICCLVLVGKKSKDDGMIHPLTFDVDTMGLVE